MKKSFLYAMIFAFFCINNLALAEQAKPSVVKCPWISKITKPFSVQNAKAFVGEHKVAVACATVATLVAMYYTCPWFQRLINKLTNNQDDQEHMDDEEVERIIKESYLRSRR